MVQIFIVIGGLIFLLLGVAHGALTLRDLKHPRAFTPPDPALRKAMQESSIKLNPTINLWRAWLGFNLTHSLSLVFFGGPFLYVGVFYPNVYAASLLIQFVAVLVSAIYVLLSLKFFFSKPVIGSTIGLACFLIAAALADITKF
ncbi:MAG: LIC_13387 family protein [Pyrinomonadaceae bacterium]